VGIKNNILFARQKNIFEEKEDAYKMPNFKAVSGETEKACIFVRADEGSAAWVSGYKAVYRTLI
jgi:hypothetical protein